MREIPGFPNYRAGDDGSVWSSFNNRWGTLSEWRKLKPGTNNKYGRQIVVLTRDGKHHSRHVHRLVLEAFVGLCPDGHEALHRDGNASNNALANLHWGTPDENDADMRGHARKKGERHHAAVLTDDMVREIRKRAASGEVHQRIADSLGIARRNVGRVADGSRWGHVSPTSAGTGS